MAQLLASALTNGGYTAEQMAANMTPASSSRQKSQPAVGAKMATTLKLKKNPSAAKQPNAAAPAEAKS